MHEKKKAEREAGEKKTKLLSDMSMMNTVRVVEDDGRRQSSKFAEK